VVEILVAIPVWNESARIAASTRLLHEQLTQSFRESGHRVRIAIAEDGSTDGTQRVLSVLKQEIPDLVVSCSPVRKGRGRALRDVWRENPADVLAYVDADLAMGPHAVTQCVNAILSGSDIAVGSRYSKGALVQRPPLVHFFSRSYNRLVRLLFRDGLLDHQCGLKVLGPRAIRGVLPTTIEDGWFWDSEFLILSRRVGLSVHEVAVDWRERKNSGTSLNRLISEAYSFSASILYLLGTLDERTSKIRDGLRSADAEPATSRPTPASTPAITPGTEVSPVR
jgi:glycosyltransferase involved in cell wall biosynthesis